ncbi:hypothetical protein [Acinetobacter sp.]|uniref:hypothetical protein n=1 Tax=Acinetobacter sp. TaxID=472 RepID=UPI0035B0A42D
MQRHQALYFQRGAGAAKHERSLLKAAVRTGQAAFDRKKSELLFFLRILTRILVKISLIKSIKSSADDFIMGIYFFTVAGGYVPDLAAVQESGR